MAKKTTRKEEYSENGTRLYLAFELSAKQWKLGFSVGLGQGARRCTVSAGDLSGLKEAIAAAKKRFGLGEGVGVVSCYEAGRDGFWLDRCLRSWGIENLVVDSSSIEVNRRKRRAKSDRLDVEKLLTMLMRYDLGEKRAWRVVRVPTAEEEDKRQCHRELRTLKQEKTRTSNRIRGLLASQGIRLKPGTRLTVKGVDEIRMWNGERLLAGMEARLKRELKHELFLHEQIQFLTKSSGANFVRVPRRIWRRFAS